MVAGSDSDVGEGDRTKSAPGGFTVACYSSTSHSTGKMPVDPAHSVAVSEESPNVAPAQHEGLRRGGRGWCGEWGVNYCS